MQCEFQQGVWTKIDQNENNQTNKKTIPGFDYVMHNRNLQIEMVIIG
jgi:hypothetical protein